MRRRAGRLIWGIALVFAGVVVASFLGRVHPIGDSFAVLRWQCAALAGGLSLVVWALGQRRGLFLALGCIAVCVPIAAAALWPQTERRPDMLVIYQKNALFQLSDTAALRDDIRAVAPDVLTLQELTNSNVGLLAELTDLLPHQHICNFNRIAAIGVATRLTPVPGQAPLCLEDDGLAGLLVEGPNGPIWLVSTHFYWPWPRSQTLQVERLVPVLSALEAPVLVGGDFNMVPWGASLAQFRRATDSARLGPLRNTFDRFGAALPLPIDHIYVPVGSQGGTERRAPLHSDHHGLVGWVALPG